MIYNQLKFVSCWYLCTIENMHIYAHAWSLGARQKTLEICASFFTYAAYTYCTRRFIHCPVSLQGGGGGGEGGKGRRTSFVLSEEKIFLTVGQVVVSPFWKFFL